MCIHTNHILNFSLSLTVDSIRQRLAATPLVTQIPLGQGKTFMGFIDLISMDTLVWERGSDGAEFSRVPLLDPSDGGGKDFGSLPTLIGPNWKHGDLPLSRERMKDALDSRSLLTEQVDNDTCIAGTHGIELLSMFNVCR